MQDFPFNIGDVVSVMNLRIRHRNTVSLDVDCPLCDDHKGKMNLNLKKNVFRCNRCGESGGMLNLYAKAYGVDLQTARKEIIEATSGSAFKREQIQRREIEITRPQITNSPMASDAEKHKTYTRLFEMLILADCHKNNLLQRGFTEEQIEANGYKSTPVYGYKKLTKRLIEEGCTVKGVPGFYRDKDGEWTLYFNRKSSGFMIPIKNMDGLINGVQIRLDHPYDGRKYIWLSSVNFEGGTTSGSPVHFVGKPGDKTVFVLGVSKDTYIPLVVGHVILSAPFVYLAVVPKLKQMDPSLYEAALDLGATPVYALFKIIIPQIASGIASGFVMAVTFSLDDYFVATYTKPATFDTISTYVVNATKGSQTDIKTALWALSTIIFLIVIVVEIAINLAPARKAVREEAGADE